MIDEAKDYTSADVLTVDDALSLAVMGYKVRASDMQEGAFIDYNFNGWRIHFPGGASSGWSQRPHDATVDWHVIDDEHVDAYKRVIAERDAEEAKVVKVVKVDAPGVVSQSQAWGRALRTMPPAPPAGLVIGEGATVWGLDRKAAPVAPPAPAEPAPSVGKWGKPAMDAMKKVTEQAAQFPEAASKWGKWGKPS